MVSDSQKKQFDRFIKDSIDRHDKFVKDSLARHDKFVKDSNDWHKKFMKTMDDNSKKRFSDFSKKSDYDTFVLIPWHGMIHS